MSTQPRSDIPFSGDDAHAFLPWVIGIMACMATLLLCLGVSVGGWIVDRGGDYANSFTVNIPPGDDASEGKILKIRDILAKHPDVISVEQVGETQLREILEPWLGQAESADSLPLPRVLDVGARPGSAPDYETLQTQLRAVIAGTEVDAHEHWVTRFAEFSAVARAFMALLAGFIMGGLALMIAFMSRASLKLHARTVQLLHSIGAEDDYITRQFQREAFLVTLRGTIPGCLLAGAMYAGTALYMQSLQASVLSLAVGPAHMALLLAMPLACAAVAWLSAHYAVIRQLRQVL